MLRFISLFSITAIISFCLGSNFVVSVEPLDYDMIADHVEEFVYASHVNHSPQFRYNYEDAKRNLREVQEWDEGLETERGAYVASYAMTYEDKSMEEALGYVMSPELVFPRYNWEDCAKLFFNDPPKDFYTICSRDKLKKWEDRDHTLFSMSIGLQRKVAGREEWHQMLNEKPRLWFPTQEACWDYESILHERDGAQWLEDQIGLDSFTHLYNFTASGFTQSTWKENNGWGEFRIRARCDYA